MSKENTIGSTIIVHTLLNLKEMSSNIESALTVFANEFLDEVIIPVCDQYNLDFISAGKNPFFSFYQEHDKKRIYINHEDLGNTAEEEKIYNEANLKPIFEVLHLEIVRDVQFGRWVKTYTGRYK